MKEIEAGIDELYRLFTKHKRVALDEVAQLLGISKAAALKWAQMLQEDKVISIESSDEGTFLVWTGKLKEEQLAPAVEQKKQKHPSAASIEQELERIVREYESKMAEIRQKSADLQELMEKRADLLPSRYIPLERKLEAELQLLHNKLAEKEHEIGELDKRLRSIPDRLAKLEEQAKKLEQIEAYARKNVYEARVKIQTESIRSRETQAAIEQHLNDANAKIEEQREKLKRIERELIRLRKIEQWMMVQQKELERGLEELSESKKESLKQYSSLRSSLTPEYFKSYIKELAALKDRYVREMHAIQKEREQLDSETREARRKLASLIKEAKELIEEFESAAAKAKRGRHAEESEWSRFEKSLESLASSDIE